jgi:probable poly-beta-1,6-N-acetyl-D-glucosamine export protein
MQQNLVNDAPKRNYDFIDHIRCIAMMSIVFEHCVGVYPFFPPYSTGFWVNLYMIQVAKFGTVIFFLLAGFLIGDKFTDYTPGQYLKRRFSNTFGPWLFWTIVFNILGIWTLHITEGMYHDGRFTMANIIKKIEETYLYTNYWFIINFMISITLLLVFKRYLYSKVFGAILLGCTLFYCINIHYEWIPSGHTIAILGFIFFLWLGAQMRKSWGKVEQWVNRISYAAIVLGLAATFALSCYETTELMAVKASDPYNTLRISAVLYALCCFLFFLKIKKFSFLNVLKPRQTTYGIYLIHYLIFIFLLNEILRPFNIDDQHLGPLGFVLFKLASFAIVYGITIGVVMLFNKTPFKKLVGN